MIKPVPALLSPRQAASSNLEVLVGSEVVHTCFAGSARVPREQAQVAAGARAGERELRASLSNGGGEVDVDGSWARARPRACDAESPYNIRIRRRRDNAYHFPRGT